ncbi:MAG: hypothetical protein GYA32_15015 [Serratia sp.]|nr:hypothetical protein [Serratia sp. (in: enterobacteria)]
MKTFIAYGVSLLLLISMAAGVFYQIDGLVTLAVSINWMICILAIPIAIATVTASILYEKSNEESRIKIAKLLVQAAKRKSFIARVTGWTTFLIMTSLFAWSGWIVTAICYVLASFILKFANSIARDEAIKQNLI